ncbi:MAG: YbgA family protein [Tissierellia bacterium]|nr:YbgA family protein [Tissierellia bacterium]
MIKKNKKACEELWAKNKYLVLSKSQRAYKEIREYLKLDIVDVVYLNEVINNVINMEENRGECVNAFQHIWGYFKTEATNEEKRAFCVLIQEYLECKKEKADLVSYINYLLLKYPNEYLNNSTLLESDENETMA